MSELLLARPYPALLAALLAVWLALLPAALGRFRRRLSAARPGTGFWLLLLAAGALVLRFCSPARHLVYYDEFDQLDAARRLAAAGVYARTLAGGLPGFDVMGPMPWPAGHPVALAAVFKLFGGSTSVANAWSAGLSALTAPVVFWAALELFGDERGALAAALLWAVSPLALRYAGACDSTAASLFWCAAAIAALAAREAEPGPLLDAFAAATLAYAVQVRFENALLLAYAAFAVRRRALLLPAALGLVFPAAIAWADHLAALPGLTPSSFAPWSDFARQAPANLAYLAAPLSLGLVAAPAALMSLKRPPARRLLVLAAALFVLYSCFYHGQFASDTDDRYYLSMLLPLSLAAVPFLSAAALPSALLIAGLACRAAPGADPAHQAAFDFLERRAPMIPERSYVLAFSPPFAREASGRPAAWIDLPVDDPAAFERGRRDAGASPELVLYRDWAWRARPEEAKRLEESLLLRYSESPLAGDGADELVLLTPRPAPARK